MYSTIAGMPRINIALDVLWDRLQLVDFFPEDRINLVDVYIYTCYVQRPKHQYIYQYRQQ